MFSSIKQLLNQVLGKDVPLPQQEEQAPESLESAVNRLIANAQTKEALDLLWQHGNKDATLLMGQWNSLIREKEQGNINYTNWQQQVSRINYAVLSLFEAPQGTVTVPELEEKPTPFPITPLSLGEREEIQNLLNADKIKEALSLCANASPAFQLLQKRYEQNRKFWLMGLVLETDWVRQEKQIAHSLRELLEKQTD